MSHFSVLVKVRPEDIEKYGNPVNAIEHLLAPYQENNMGDCPKEYLTWHDTEDENLKTYETDGSDVIKCPDGIDRNPWDEMFRKPGSFGIGGDTHKAPEGWPRVKVPYKERFATFEEYMEVWCGCKSRNPEKGRYGYWENVDRYVVSICKGVQGGNETVSEVQSGEVRGGVLQDQASEGVDRAVLHLQEVYDSGEQQEELSSGETEAVVQEREVRDFLRGVCEDDGGVERVMRDLRQTQRQGTGLVGGSLSQDREGTRSALHQLQYDVGSCERRYECVACSSAVPHAAHIVVRLVSGKKWDWYVIGGRYCNKLPVKAGVELLRGERSGLDRGTEPEPDRWCDVTQVKCLDLDEIAAKSLRGAEQFWADYQSWVGRRNVPWKEKTDADHQLGFVVPDTLSELGFCTFDPETQVVTEHPFTYEDVVAKKDYWNFKTYAVLDNEGWHSKGDMGWWGCSSDMREESDAWNRSFFKRFLESENPETWLVCVDAHI